MPVEQHRVAERQEPVVRRRAPSRTGRASAARRTRRSSSAASCAAGGSSSAARRRPRTSSRGGGTARCDRSSAPVAAADSRARTLVVPTATTRPRRTARGPRRLGHAVALAVHAMVERVGLADRLERVEPDHELDRVDRRRRRLRCASSSSGVTWRPAVGAAAEPGCVGVHGLVAVPMVEARRDVRRQGHLADVVEQRQRVDPGRVDEVDVERVAGRRARPDDEHRPALGGDELLAVAQLAGRAHEGLPVAPARVLRFQQQHLGRPPLARRSRRRAGITFVSLTTTTVAVAAAARRGRRP